MPRFCFNLKSFYNKIKNDNNVKIEKIFNDVTVYTVPILKYHVAISSIIRYIDNKNDTYQIHKCNTILLELTVTNVGCGNYMYELGINGINDDNIMIKSYICNAYTDGKVKHKEDRIILRALTQQFNSKEK